MIYDFIKLYLKYLKSSGKSPKTISTYSFALQKFNNWRIDNSLLIKEVGRDSILSFRNTLVDEGLKPATVNLILNVLYSFYDFLSTEGYIKGNPVNIKKNKVLNELNQVKPFTPEEIDQIESILNNYLVELKLPVLLLLHSGLSIKEIANLTPSDIILIQRHVFLRTKSFYNTHRHVPIINQETARELLLLTLKMFKEYRIFNISEKSIKNYLNFIAESLNMQFTYKRIKKTYSQYLLNSGCPNKVVRWILGYKSSQKVSPEDLFPFTVKI